MKDVFGLIISGTEDQELRDLTMMRSIAAVPIAGRYRVIDFYLSNLVNSGIHNVGVITYRNYHSLMDHISGGVEWDLSRKRDGLFILPPMSQHTNHNGFYSGTAEAINGVKSYISRCAQNTCLLHTNCRTIFNTNYSQAYEYHKSSGADITMMYGIPGNKTEPPSKGEAMISVDESGAVTDVFPGRTYKKSDYISMDTYFINKDLLLRLVDDCVMRGGTDFIRDIIIPSLGKLNVKGFYYTEPSYKIDTLERYFKASLAFLDTGIRNSLIDGSGPVYTKVKDEVPARYSKSSRVANSLVSDGCYIEGSIENSLLFRGVQVARGAVIKNCIIMQESQIQANAVLENVILDKKCTILRGRRMVGTENHPMIVAKGSTI
ncbi:MAG: glucose-1-phosphate adenylyltransferase subunit GlgD [Clostridia bacterium]|nr:glucose-1-phosphate adenylyltransferase subunit GlgD [Clostridia bacterium]